MRHGSKSANLRRMRRSVRAMKWKKVRRGALRRSISRNR